MNMPRQLFFMLTQGCKVNQYESQSIREAWTRQGLLECDEPDHADIIFINTCAVTERAISDLKRHVRRLHQKNPEASILLAGCAVQALPELARLNGVRAAVSQADKHLLRNHPGLLPLTDAPAQADPYPDFSITRYQRTRGVVKIQDGCSHRCTYCIIPSTRGKSVSREPQAILEEIGRLFTNGVHEISLCGINLRHFGRDLHPRTNLWELLERIEERFGQTWRSKARIRLSSLEPSELTAQGLQALTNSSLVCPHVHVSLQSGSPHVLRRMGRGHYTPEMVMEFVEGLRRVWPVFALGADIITGFPGETDTHFEETLDCLGRLPLTYAHVFPYSRRPGTAAASFEDQVPHKERTLRAARVRTLVQAKKQDFIRLLAQRESLEVIFENGRKGMSQFYVPCQLTESGLIASGDRTLHTVTPTGQNDHGLLVTPAVPGKPGER
ncbi:MiaB/RimO family radical SAM methylthiotransferase [Desulfoplanes formicivorans]|uniref:Radical SAM protein n=1 Tax=Desulfoplanes formicivorans TaxID=1592317 RepID=A0A194AFF2_9BACT|nr:MiaB/RimO family radical SAM methylthiotransferase [Desulfoplanes formicivorans]GAU07509.1 radical SAM protein [Desulfoplanes formicivorans]